MKSIETKILGRNYAYHQNFRALTTPYKPEEEWMLQNVLSDMRRGNIEHCLVQTLEGLEVHRKGMKTVRYGKVFDVLQNIIAFVAAKTCSKL